MDHICNSVRGFSRLIPAILLLPATLSLACGTDQQNDMFGPPSSVNLNTLSSGPCSGLRYTRLVSVSTAAQLSLAVKNARAGDLIQLAPATYNGRWTMTQSGTATAPTVLCGPRTAVLNGGSISQASGIFLNGARYWILRGFTVTNSRTGVSGDNALYNQILSLEIRNVGQPGVHLRVFSK